MERSIIVPIFLVLQVVLLFVGTMISLKNPPIDSRGDRKLPIMVRILLSLSLVVIAYVIFNITKGEYKVYTKFVVLGMIFSFIGDMIIAEVFKVSYKITKGIEKSLLCGMIAFAIGHGMYITAYIETIVAAEGGNITKYLIFSIIIFILLLILGWLLFVYKIQEQRKERIGVVIYTAWIGVMATFAFILSFELGGTWWLTFIGAVSFMISDGVIGIKDVNFKDVKNGNLIIWWTYIIAQMCIIYSRFINCK